MHVPKAFAIQDRAKMLAFIEQNGFGQLVSHHQNQLYASHVPFLLSACGEYLETHLARVNTQYKDLDGQTALIIFTGAHDYISPTWYENWREKSTVPTWDFQAVHVYAQCEVYDDEVALVNSVERLAYKYEKDNQQPWQGNYSKALIRGIMGVKLNIASMQCQFKLSQNRSVKDRENIIQQLRQRGANELANSVEQALKNSS